jgi:hypothetical protein
MWLFSAFVYYISSIFRWIFREPPKINDLIKPSKTELYKEFQKNAFIKTFGYEYLFNKNIEPVFYIRGEYNKVLQTPNNHLEEIWKTRILFETMDGTNIVMCYDAYKEGFSYYSDKQIGYDSLNAIAMKYCRIFMCRDFFIDETICTDDNMISPFLKIIREADEVEKEKKKKSIANQTVKGGPFAKFKSYTKESSNNVSYSKTSLEDKMTEKECVKEIYKNKFIYLGKITNFTPLKTIPKSRISFSTELSKSLVETSVKSQSHVLSYRDFKSRSRPPSEIVGTA